MTEKTNQRAAGAKQVNIDKGQSRLFLTVFLFVVLFICGCSGGDLPVYEYEPVQLYSTEQRLDNLERNARESRIREQITGHNP